MPSINRGAILFTNIVEVYLLFFGKRECADLLKTNNYLTAEL
jgi:hypothetical protein